MKIIAATVILTTMMDQVVLYTDLPCPVPPSVLPSQDPLALLFHTTYDTGVDYVRRVFGIEPVVKDLRV